MRRIAPIAAALILCTHAALAQMLYNPNDERFKAMYLEKVQTDYKVQKTEFERQKLLHDKKLISEKEFAESEASFKNAQITYQQAILSIAYDQPQVRVRITDDGTAKAPGAHQGHGINGMRERAALHGGTLRAGPNPDGPQGWLVEATLGRRR